VRRRTGTLILRGARRWTGLKWIIVDWVVNYRVYDGFGLVAVVAIGVVGVDCL
jgi:hypothetical protein